MLYRRTLPLVAAVAALVSLAAPARTADLTIATLASPTAIDPHWMTSPSNWMVNHHVFEPLVRRDNTTGAIEPWLASSWKKVNDSTWEFYLRKDVKWHDGTPFTAEDVLFTIKRIPIVPNAPNPFVGYLKYFERVEAPDPHTVRIITKGTPTALLMDVAYLLMVQKKTSETATTGDFNSGKAAIGTGPYTFVSYALNDRTILKKNPNYWGEKEPWDNLTFKVMTNDASRTAALLAGDVDVIETVPTQEIERLRTDKRLTLYSKPTGRVIMLNLDPGEDAISGGRMTAMDGTPLKANPFADRRVREAFKLAVDPEAVIQRIYNGEGLATGQYLLPGVFGFIPDVKVWKQDTARARKLLEEAGWADKFKLTVGVSENNYPNAVKTAQAMAQFWTRIGVQTDVAPMPFPVYLNQRRERKMPVTIGIRNNSPLVADTFYPVVIHSNSGGKDDDGLGTSNFSRYSNPEVDKLIQTAMTTIDDTTREALYQEAGRKAIADIQITPLYLLNETTATKNTLTFIPRPDRLIFAMNVRAK